MSFDFESLGFTKEELQQRVVDQICDSLLTGGLQGEDGNVREPLQRKMNTEIQRRIDDAIADLGKKYVLPNVVSHMEQLVLQKTTSWGEKSGEPKTFIQYLIDQANVYLTEKVDHNGNGKNETSYSWSGTQTRIAYMINHHLHYSIKTAMEQALVTANKSIAAGIEETVKIKLQEIANGMKVAVSTK